jgi:LysR family nitrogen assimilation transcriptional regulator
MPIVNKTGTVRDLAQLESFIRIAELGSFTKAANVLGVAQPALSRQVRALEVALKASLFQRNGRGVVPTEAGQRFLDHARRLLAGVDAAVRAVHGQGACSGRVSIGMPPSVGKVLTLPLVTRLLTQYPQVSLAVVEGLSGSLHEQLVSGRLDVAVLWNPVPARQILAETIGTEPLYLIAPRSSHRRGSVRSVKEIASLPLILPSAPHSIRSMIEGEAARETISLAIKVDVDSVPAMLDLVAAGYGYSIVPRNVLRGAFNRAKCTWHRILVPSLRISLCIATRLPRRTDGPIQETVDVLRPMLGQVLTSRTRRQS